MQIKRKLYDRLLEWKKAKGQKALLIEGARRIGKSTLAEEFGKREYRACIMVDFNKASKRVLDAFDNMVNLDVFFQTLSLEYATRLYPRESLIVFDEIQKFPKARECIKYLVADGRYDFIETGSLISIRENVETITIPSEERCVRMYPLDFEEFAGAFGEEILYEQIGKSFAQKVPLAREDHNRAMRLFKEYLLVGGMPKAVTAYLEHGRDFFCADEEKRDILNLYRNDIKKAAKRYSSKASALFENIPGYLSTHEKRVVLSEIDKNGTYDKYDEPLFWLDDSMICNLCYKCTDPNVGFALNRNDSAVKCYMGDTGLLFSLAFNEDEIVGQNLYKLIINDKLSLNKGMLYENAIAQMLVACGRKLYFYTRFNEEKHRNDIEVNFLVSNESKTNFRISPIEVKSSKNYTATSLERFRGLFESRTECSYIIHPKNFSMDGNLIRIPPYMVPFAMKLS